MKKLSFLFLLALFAQIIHAATYYVDPATGSMSNSGTSSQPWSTLEAVFTAGKTFSSGDVIYLLNGNHGNPVITTSNTANVTITKFSTHNPVINSIDFNNANFWTLKDVKVSANGAAFPNQNVPLEHPVYPLGDNALVRIVNSNNIIIDGCNINSIEDNSAWTATNWNTKAWNGIMVSAGTSVVLKNNHIKNVNFGAQADNDAGITIDNNIIENFCGDGIRPDCNYAVVQNNTIKNVYDTNGNHDDMIQVYTGGNVTGVIIRGNKMYNYTDPNQPFKGSAQGLGFFDGMYINFVIENNLVVVDHWHGITLLGAQNCKIVNNTVIDPDNTNYGPPWIQIGNHKDGTASTGNIVSNNLTTDVGSVTGTSVSNNIEISWSQYSTYFNNYANFDYTTKAGSPAIDAGTSSNAPSVDINGTNRPQGSGYDVGAFEYTEIVSLASNVALGKPVTASSVKDNAAANAVDGNPATRWSSNYSQPEWIYVDLGQTYSISRVVLSWETAYGSGYEIQVSDNATNWTTIYNTSTGNGGTDDITGLSGNGRYVRMYGITRATSWGFSLWEFEVYGSIYSTVPVTGVSVLPPALTLDEGETSDLTETVSPSNATNKSVTWSSSNASVATVNTSGLVTAVSAGNATITVTTVDGSYAATCDVTVNVPGTLPSPWTNGDVGAVAATGSATYTDGTFTIQGSGANIWGTADEFQFVYQQISGDATITARITSLTNPHQWTKGGVMMRETLNTGSINGHTFLAPIASNGSKFSYRATTNATSSEFDGPNITAPYWLRMQRTGNTFTGSVSIDGTTWTTLGSTTLNMSSTYYVGLAVTSLVDGTLATATFDNVTLSSTVPVTGVSVSPTTLTLDEGQTSDLTETVSPSNAANKSVTWSSNNISVATVNSSGLVTAVSAGNATITVTTVDGNFTANCGVTVDIPVIPVTGVTLSSTSITLEEGQTDDLDETVSPANATDKSVAWSSDNTSVARVDTSGLVTAIAEGSAIITVSTINGGFTATCNVTVNEASINLALNQPITVSAYQDDAFGYKPGENLVDGNVSDDARWSASGFPQWAEIDLGANYDLNQIDVYPYQDRAYQYIVEAKPDGGSYTTIVDKSANTENADLLVSAVDMTARYVKITVSGLYGNSSTWVSLLELEVWGTTSGSFDTEAPSVPANLASANITTSSVDLSWNASTDNIGVTGYKVYINGSNPVTVTGISTTINGLSASTQYSFTVSAIDAASNESAQSSAIQITTATPPDTEAPSVPTGLTASNVTTSSVDLSWNASTDNVGVTGYKVYTNGANPVSVTGISKTITGLASSTQYSFTVSAIDAASNESAQSSSVNATTSAASGITSNATWQSFTLPTQTGVFTATFDAVPNGSNLDALTGILNGSASTYADIACAVRFYTNGQIDARNGGSYAATNVVNYTSGVSYHFRVEISVPTHTYSVYVTPQGSSEQTVASNFAFRSEQSGVNQLTGWTIYAASGSHTVSNMAFTQAAPDTEAPSMPTSLTASSIYATGFTLSWTASMDNVGVTGYEVFKNGISIGTTTITSMSVTGLTPSTTYSMVVKACDAVPNWSSLSSVLNVTTEEGSTGDWPNLSNTGPSGTLTPYSGNMTITTNGTLIQNLAINGNILIQANNVTIRNCTFGTLSCSSAYTGTVVEDCELAWAGSMNFTLRRCFMTTQSDDLIRISGGNVTIEDCYLLITGPRLPGSHADNIQEYPVGSSFNNVIRHNTLHNECEATACINMGGGGVSIINNLIAGGAFAIYSHGAQITDNHFSTIYFPSCGNWGVFYYSDNTCSGNVWHETGAPVNCSSSGEIEFAEAIQQDIKVYPNPVIGNTINIKTIGYEDVNIVIYDLVGKIIYNQNYFVIDKAELQISVGDLNRGVYIISVNNKQQKLFIE